MRSLACIPLEKKMDSQTLARGSALLTLLTCSSMALAASYTGSSSGGDWSSSSTWGGSTPPGESDDVTLPVGANFTYEESGGGSVNSIDMPFGTGSLTVEEDLTVNDTLTVHGARELILGTSTQAVTLSGGTLNLGVKTEIAQFTRVNGSLDFDTLASFRINLELAAGDTIGDVFFSNANGSLPTLTTNHVNNIAGTLEIHTNGGNYSIVELGADLALSDDLRMRGGELYDNGNDITVGGTFTSDVDSSRVGASDASHYGGVVLRDGGTMALNNVDWGRTGDLDFRPGDTVSGDIGLHSFGGFPTCPTANVTQGAAFDDASGSYDSGTGLTLADTATLSLDCNRNNQGAITLNWDTDLSGDKYDWALRWSGDHVTALQDAIDDGYIVIGTLPSGETFDSSNHVIYDAEDGYTYIGFELDPLVAYYPFNDSDDDESGNANDATSGSSISYPAGLCGDAASFDASSGSVVSVPSQPLEDFTIAAWFSQSSDTGTWQRVWDFGTTNAAGGEFFVAVNHGRLGSNLGAGIHDASGDRIDDLDGGFSPSNDTWHHVVMTYDQDAGVVALYVDGSEADTHDFETDSFADFVGTQSWLLGQSNFSSDPRFNGLIDEVRVYRAALSAAEVSDLYGEDLTCGDADGDGVLGNFDLCPADDSTGNDADADGCTDLTIDDFTTTVNTDGSITLTGSESNNSGVSVELPAGSSAGSSASISVYTDTTGNTIVAIEGIELPTGMTKSASVTIPATTGVGEANAFGGSRTCIMDVASLSSIPDSEAACKAAGGFTVGYGVNVRQRDTHVDRYSYRTVESGGGWSGRYGGYGGGGTITRNGYTVEYFPTLSTVSDNINGIVYYPLSDVTFEIDGLANTFLISLKDTDGDGLPDGDEADLGTDETLVDSDGDGVSDFDEAEAGTNPLDDSDFVLVDADGDGLSLAEEQDIGTDPNLADTDSDGVTDLSEMLDGTDPLDSDDSSFIDLDSDGIDDGAQDDDGDGLSARDEARYGTDPDLADTDGDGVLDFAELFIYDTDPLDSSDTVTADSDGDGLDDDADNCILVSNVNQDNTDGDLFGDACDDDDDNDGVVDANDQCNGGDDFVDVDVDGVPDGCDVCMGPDNVDTDGDGVCNEWDVCPTDATDTDTDNDNVCDVDDACLGDDTFGDTDGDQICDDLDLCEGNDSSEDTDLDGICGDIDNCPADSNADQDDTDGDGVGDDCEADTDGDGVIDDDDNCNDDGNPDQSDLDSDGDGDICDADDDGDGIDDENDVCPFIADADQTDTDGDGYGDVCDGDDDGDGVGDAADECPGTPIGALYNAAGCSGEQVVEQECGTAADYSWRKSGRYIRCVTKEAKNTYRAGLITKRERTWLIRRAAFEAWFQRVISRLRRWC